VRLEGLGQFKMCSDIGIRTRDLLACSIVPQPTTPPRAPKGQVPVNIMCTFKLTYSGGEKDCINY
jgi:hypothetical protein